MKLLFILGCEQNFTRVEKF